MADERPILYGYWRSSAAYRVRIALNLKGIEYEQRPVDLSPASGEQHRADYRDLNPAGLVPTLVIGGQAINQSIAICEYLEEVLPSPALLPREPAARARCRALALDIACDIHPLNNLRVLQHLRDRHALDDGDIRDWMHHWMGIGFAAFERRLARSAMAGDFCCGDEPGLADLCLVPQIYNAERFECPLDAYPRMMRIAEACRAVPAFADAAPENQPDAP